jgi:hypothetical protein
MVDVERWIAEARTRAKRLRCPDCGADDPLPLIVGEPGAEWAEPAARGEVALGGCVVFGEVTAEWRCRRCTFEWAASSPWQGYRPGQEQVLDATLSSCSEEDVVAALQALDVAPRIVPASGWPGELEGLREAGLYSWWVDAEGAAELSEGLELPLAAARIYAGQAGATKWPSGTPSSATLESRIRSQHLGGNIYGSTSRLTLASCLVAPLGLRSVGRKRLESGGEERLTAWIEQHLSVAVYAYPNRDALESLEHRVLERLDPPLNLRGMGSTLVRARLQTCRKALLAQGASSKPVSAIGVGSALEPAPAPTARGITLHEEIEDILRGLGNRWMTTRELADAVNERGRYHKRDGSKMTDFQIHGRTRNYDQLFEREGAQVRLREPAS